MSLKVWLPLNGNLQNKGLNDTNITNNGATVDNSGKIGKCYTFNGTSSYITLNNLTCAGWSEFSLSCWCYPTADFTALFLIRGASAHRIKVNADGFTFRDNNNSSQRTTSFGTTIPLNTWSYITCVYNRGEVFMYVNGVQTNHSTAYYHADSQFLSDHNETRIGRQQSSSSNVYYTGKINDFRIYNHALSLKEVKEISKGLILHYPLDNNGLGNSNLIFDSYYNVTPWVDAIQEKNIDFKGKTSIRYTQSTLYTKTSKGTTSIFPQMTFKENTVYTFSGYYNDTYRTDGKTTGARFRFKYNDDTLGTLYNLNTSFTADENGWRYFTITSTAGKTVSGITASYGNAGQCILAYVKIEEGSIATKFTPGIEQNIIYDTSGHQNNGTKNGSDYTVSTDTLRYDVSTHFTGTNYISLTSPCAEAKTVSLWVKWDTIPSGSSVILVDYKSKLGFGLTSSGILCGTQGSGNYYYFSKSNLIANTWYHFVIVNPGTSTSTERKLYINGIEQTHISSSSYWSYSLDQLQLGKRSTTSDGFQGLISDFRMYTTVLNDEDILELYHISAFADRNNNFYTYGKFNEIEDNVPFIQRTAITNIYKLNETIKDNLLLNTSTEKVGNSADAQWFRWDVGNPYLTTNILYTLSFDAKITNTSDVFYIGFANNDSTQQVMFQENIVTTEYKRYTFTKATTKTNINSIVISNAKRYNRGNENNTGSTLYVKNIKLELGDYSTPYTQAGNNISNIYYTRDGWLVNNQSIEN